MEKTADGLRVTTRVKNVGQRAGDEVAQLYLNFPDAPGAPRVALRGFERMALQPGEEKEAVFDLSPRDLSSVDPAGVRRVAAGHYRVSVGSGQPSTGVPGQSAAVDLPASAPLPL